MILKTVHSLSLYYLDDTEKFALENKMKINPKKTKILTFNKSRKYDFPPELHFSIKEMLEVVSDIKLVGVILSDALRWKKNTNYICFKAAKKLWTLRRLKNFKLDPYQIFDVYCKEVRSLLEMAVPVWHSSLTKYETNQIKNVQKTAFKVILGPNYNSNDNKMFIFQVIRSIKLRIK